MVRKAFALVAHVYILGITTVQSIGSGGEVLGDCAYFRVRIKHIASTTGDFQGLLEFRYKICDLLRKLATFVVKLCSSKEKCRI